MANIENLEIFGAGVHNAMTGKVTITENDLDEIVEAFASLSGTNIVKPHLKLGHTDAQKWFGQKDGIPALGWITKVWRAGSKLLASVSDVPESIIGMIRAKRYHNVSAEVYWDAGIEHEGKKFNRVLSAVSLLGVEMPAVKDLAGLASALFKTGPIHQFAEKKPTELNKEIYAMFTQEQVDSLISAAVNKATDELEKKFKGELDDAKQKLEVSDKSRTVLASELDTVKANAAQAEAKSLVDTAIKDGKLMPKQREFALAFLASGDAKMKFGEGEKGTAALFKEFLDASGKVIDTDEKGSGKNKKTEFSNAAEEVDTKTKELIEKDNKLSYQDAMGKVLASDADLKTRYAAING